MVSFPVLPSYDLPQFALLTFHIISLQSLPFFQQRIQQMYAIQPGREDDDLGEDGIGLSGAFGECLNDPALGGSGGLA